MATGKQVFNVKSLLHVVSRYLYILYALFKSCYDIAEPLQSNHVIGNTRYDDDEWANNYTLLRFSVMLCYVTSTKYGHDLLSSRNEHMFVSCMTV